MADGRKYITISKDLFEDSEELHSYTNEQIGIIFKAYISGAVFGMVEKVTDPLCKRVLRDLFKEDGQALSVWERNDKNGTKGGRPPKPKENPNETQTKPTLNPNTTQEEPKKNPIEIEEEREREKEEEREVRKSIGAKAPALPRMTRPTLLEVKDYIQEKGYKVIAEQWYDFYEANGWKVGRNPMKDWKACIRSWNQREQKEQANRPKTNHEEFMEIYQRLEQQEAEHDPTRDNDPFRLPF